jgi:hypothetical protein
VRQLMLHEVLLTGSVGRDAARKTVVFEATDVGFFASVGGNNINKTLHFKKVA